MNDVKGFFIKGSVPDLKTICRSGLLGISAAVFSGYLLGFIMPAFPNLMEEYSDDISALISGSAVLLFYVLILAPVFEELLFRLFIYNLAKRFTNDTAAIIIQAVLFGLYHGNIVQIIYAFLLGLLLGWIRKKTEHVLYCLIFHCFFNITGVIMDRFSKIEQPLLLRSIILTLTCAVSVFLIWSLNRSRNGCDGQTD
ncbi:MAG: CPBP family intramembrane metalloprotease [Lachnospiraceae bacterium]|nr:CPBP family intramembrane metalloprotease [Lachnospiraceae bacterium]